MIPRIIHFIWFGAPMPAWARDNIAEFRRLNPGYALTIHGGEVLLGEYAATYRATEDICTRADILALSALQREGGWYFDVDNWPFRSVDAITEAYGLDGRRMFVTEQHGQRDLSLRIANSTMAARADWVGWPVIRERIAGARPPIGRCDFGPTMLTAMAERHPAAFVIGGWPFFFPAEIGRAARLYAPCRKPGSDIARRLAPTAGQLPFLMHLWAGGEAQLRPDREPGLTAFLPGSAGGPFAGLRACLAFQTIQWEDPVQPFRAIGEGLAALGFDVEVHGPERERTLETADLMVVWNGRESPYRERLAEARRLGVPTLVMEHGFFERQRHVQLDHAGILHWASWAEDWDAPPPADADGRLAAVWPDELVPFAPRRGYVLVLGQLDGDTQMHESEIKVTTPLHECVYHWARQRGIEARFRPHPLARPGWKPFLPVCEAPSLEEAVAGARFGVTINSNAGNDCLAWGCPVGCVGPALYAKAGVALQSRMAGMPTLLDRMLAGWSPESHRVRHYLRWLACRQYGEGELRDGTALRRILAPLRLEVTA